jgi:hypothetical protein
MHAVLFVGLALAGKRSIQTLAILGLLRGMFSNGLPEVGKAQLYRLTHRFRQQAGSYRPGFFWMGLHWNLCRRRRSALARECGFAHTSTSPDKTRFTWVLLDGPALEPLPQA